MLHTVSKLISLARPKDEHAPCELHRNEAAGLRSQMHDMYDDIRQLRNSLNQALAEKARLKTENTVLSTGQQENLIQELADRIIQQKMDAETPAVALPCTQHHQAAITFARN